MRPRRAPSLLRRALLASVALLAGAVTLSSHVPVATADSVATERYRDKNWKFSFLKFKDWEQVPLETKGTGPGDLYDDCLVARFAQGERTPGAIRVFRMVNGQAGGRPTITSEPGKPDAPATPGAPGTPPAPGAPPAPGTPPAPGAPSPTPPPSPPSPPSGRGGPAAEKPPKNMVELLDRYFTQRWQLPAGTLFPKGDKEVKSKDGVPGRLWLVEVPKGPFYTVAIFEKEGVEVGLVFGCAESERKKLEGPFATGCRSFRWYDDRAEDAEGLPQLEGVRLSARKRREIETGLVAGWSVVVSPKKNYVVVYNTKGRTNTPLAKMIAERIELIRAQVYEVQFPPSGPIDAVSIVRLCGDAAEYHQYGGPPGSAGYWNDDSEELVFYDASPKREADDDTLAVLYHEAFHQYIYYSVGKVAPHSWFNEGHGDYYAGARYADRKFVIRPFAWRVPVVKAAIQKGPCDFDVVQKDGEMVRKWDRSCHGYSPLAQLVEMDQGEYYAYPGVSYAQGWSLVYFLREIVPKNPKWNEKWGKILTTYFDTLKAEVKRIEDEEAAAKAKATPAPKSPPPGGAPTTPAAPTPPTDPKAPAAPVPGTPAAPTPAPTEPAVPAPAAPASPPAPSPAPTPPAPTPPAPTPPAPTPSPAPTPPAPTPPSPAPSPAPTPPAPTPPTPPTPPPPPAGPSTEPPPDIGMAKTHTYSSSDKALRKALRAAFEGVDFDELEAAWKESMAKVSLKR